MFLTYWNDGKICIFSFKSPILLAGFLHQQFCFLRQKISFFHFDSDWQVVVPKFTPYYVYMPEGDDVESTSPEVTEEQQPTKKQLAYFSNYSTCLSLSRFLCQKEILHEIFKAFQKVEVHHLFSWCWTIDKVGCCKEICQALGKSILSGGIPGSWSYLHSPSWSF